MQIICSSKSFAFIKKNIKNQCISSFILSIKNYNLFNEYVYSCDEVFDVVKYIKKHDKTVIVDVAKLIHEDELQNIREIIVKLESAGVDLFMYSDFGLYQILCELGLKHKTMLYSNTYLTNVLDTKIYQEKNKFVVLSNQINTNELIHISKNAYSNQIVSAFGVAMIMYTRRPLLTNYFKYRNSDKDSGKTNYYLQEEYRDSLYPIIENENSTKIYDYGHYYLTTELSELPNNIDIIVSGELLKDKVYQIIIDKYVNYLKEGTKISFDDVDVILNKGAYSRKLTLLKGGNQDE